MSKICTCCGVKHDETGQYCIDCHDCDGSCDWKGSQPYNDRIRDLEAANTDLLAALESIRQEVCGQYQGCFQDALSGLSIRRITEAAIKKARGES